MIKTALSFLFSFLVLAGLQCPDEDHLFTNPTRQALPPDPTKTAALMKLLADPSTQGVVNALAYISKKIEAHEKVDDSVVQALSKRDLKPHEDELEHMLGSNSGPQVEVAEALLPSVYSGLSNISLINKLHRANPSVGDVKVVELAAKALMAQPLDKVSFPFLSAAVKANPYSKEVRGVFVHALVGVTTLELIKDLVPNTHAPRDIELEALKLRTDLNTISEDVLADLLINKALVRNQPTAIIDGVIAIAKLGLQNREIPKAVTKLGEAALLPVFIDVHNFGTTSNDAAIDLLMDYNNPAAVFPLARVFIIADPGMAQIFSTKIANTYPGKAHFLAFGLGAMVPALTQMSGDGGHYILAEKINDRNSAARILVACQTNNVRVKFPLIYFLTNSKNGGPDLPTATLVVNALKSYPIEAWEITYLKKEGTMIAKQAMAVAYP